MTDQPPDAHDPTLPPDPTPDRGAAPVSVPAQPAATAPAESGPDQHPALGDDPIRGPRRAAAADRWAHRRGEPRVLAFAWTLFLLAATVILFATSGSGAGIDPEGYRSAARGLIVTAAVGVSILWPMLRLSQVFPGRRPVRDALRDWVVIVVPLQAVVWPQAWIGRWPPGAMAAVTMVLASWGVVSAGVVALGARLGTGGAARAAGCAVAIVLAGAGWAVSTVLFVAGLPVAGDAARLWSPVTAVLAAMSDRPYVGHWVVLPAGLIVSSAGAAAAGVTILGWAALTPGRGRAAAANLH